MVRDKELIVFKPRREQSLPNLYALPGTKRPINDNALYGHEMDCADCFVALRQTYGERLIRWQRRWNDKERKVFGDKYNIWPDRIFEIDGLNDVFFLEVDRGTEDIQKQIKPKMLDYLKLHNAYRSTQSFTVLFTAQGYRYHSTDEDRRDELANLLNKPTNSCRFIVVTQDAFTTDPASYLTSTYNGMSNG